MKIDNNVSKYNTETTLRNRNKYTTKQIALNRKQNIRKKNKYQIAPK